ncbi:PilZ domain-containing protein [Vibrio ostreicida]|uniref:Cyclic diguanosine monophosphate-binding protein n=1 Tax=Vibrio ostreicida TaxID=526588 RepID=A0ABT8BUP9_9VIBR|nr:PilZ domain-containing protein [Vibrio ostreicida]MDN3610892.1 PilZ domain-containing protein [Vibrio ostreicida]NPD10474.1 PilZ domain-containing protein [Vibrio ostreicida]
MIERRKFSRIVYQTEALLSQRGKVVTSSVCDLSLHGLLVTSDDADSLELDSMVDVQFSLQDTDITIALVGKIVGLNNNVIRISIDHIDIESIGHLKRLIELNVGDDELLHRDIEHLSDLGEYT